MGSFFIGIKCYIVVKITKGDFLREKIYYFVAKPKARSISYFYEMFISTISVVSILPLMFKEGNISFYKIEKFTVYILIIDYLLRFLVCDFTICKGKLSFIIYFFKLSSVIDLICILPFGRLFRVFRVFKMFRYMEVYSQVVNVYKRVKRVLYTVLLLCVSYIFVTALFMFNAEGESFENFFEALYWATTALTTVGYGDIYPKTVAGRIISMVTSIFGIAIIALPSGVITADFIREIGKK